MAWERRNGRGHYYTRSLRVGKRVVRQYIGAGALAEAMAALDAAERRTRATERERWRRCKARYDALDAQAAEGFRQTSTMIRGLLALDGYHQHHRGEWRRKRGAKGKDES
ncbi:hypothetical protein FJZ36_10275 [Candidatus Poribacteria bacterium]|nr:hypothetical protein [Candidatus Poribacteria bacterium]